MTYRTTAAALVSLLAAGCTNQQLYTAVQERERQECARLPQAQYEECMREVEGSYDEYAREREELKSGKYTGQPYR